MAYSLYEEAQLNNPTSTHYYPDEYDYPSYYHKISEVKVNYPSDQSTRKTKKATASINYVDERKCPIYVHQYNKVQSTYNYSSVKPAVEKTAASKTKKIPGFPRTKSVLDQLEETYWATWKPKNKENTVTMSRKNRDHKIPKIKDYGDVPDNIGSCFTSSEYEPSTASAVDETDYEKYNKKYETVINMYDACETRKNSVRLKTTHTQEIQTDNVLMTLPKIEEHVENDETVKDQTDVMESGKSEEKAKLIEKSSDEESTLEVNKEQTKFLKHTDSFIIHKKKQGEVKEHFQQPKCIRLYRKPGVSTSFIKGGSYPLKSCLKREPTTKGNFRLGAPGSPLFVSTSSFHKKSRK